MPSDGKSSHCLWQGELKYCLENNILWQLINVFTLSIIKS